MAKKKVDITEREQVYVEPKNGLNKIYIYHFNNKKLWCKFHTNPPFKNKPIYHYIKQLL